MTSCLQTLYNVFNILFYILCFANSFSDGTLLHCGGRTRAPIFETWRETNRWGSAALFCTLRLTHLFEKEIRKFTNFEFEFFVKEFHFYLCLFVFYFSWGLIWPLTPDIIPHTTATCFSFLGPSCVSPQRWLCQCEIPSSSAGWETPTSPSGTNDHVHHVQSHFNPLSSPFRCCFDLLHHVYMRKCTELLPRDCLTNYLF